MVPVLFRDRARPGRLREVRRRFRRAHLATRFAEVEFDDATFDRSAAAFDNPDHVAIVVHNTVAARLAEGDEVRRSRKALAEVPVITVPTITLEGEADGAPHPAPVPTPGNSRASTAPNVRAAPVTICRKKHPQHLPRLSYKRRVLISRADEDDPAKLRLFNPPHLANHGRNEFRDCRMDRHGPLKVAIGRSPIDGIEYAMDRLVAARPEDRAAEDLAGLGMGDDLHEAQRLTLLYPHARRASLAFCRRVSRGLPSSPRPRSCRHGRGAGRRKVHSLVLDH